jgi:hypothetical protein
VPLIFVAITTLVAGTMNIMNLFLPMMLIEKTQLQGIINLLLTIVIMGSVVIVIADAIPKWIAVVRGKQKILKDEFV